VRNGAAISGLTHDGRPVFLSIIARVALPAVVIHVEPVNYAHEDKWGRDQLFCAPTDGV